MGREIRRVPPNWEHPKKDDGQYQCLLDEEYETAANIWLADCIAWADGTHIECKEYKEECPFYWDYAGSAPKEEYYRPVFTEEPTWVQVYETVSEGTPVTPPFETKEELVEYLVENGDYWDQRRGDGGWNRESAEGFVKTEWAMSGMINTNDGVFRTPKDMEYPNEPTI